MTYITDILISYVIVCLVLYLALMYQVIINSRVKKDTKSFLIHHGLLEEYVEYRETHKRFRKLF